MQAQAPSLTERPAAVPGRSGVPQGGTKPPVEERSAPRGAGHPREERSACPWLCPLAPAPGVTRVTPPDVPLRAGGAGVTARTGHIRQRQVRWVRKGPAQVGCCGGCPSRRG